MFGRKISADFRVALKMLAYKNVTDESDDENILQDLQREALIGTDGLKVHSINLTTRLNYNKIDVVTEPTFRLTINRKIGFEQLIDDANKWQII
jgi:hypothetical protein